MPSLAPPRRPLRASLALGWLTFAAPALVVAAPASAQPAARDGAATAAAVGYRRATANLTAVARGDGADARPRPGDVVRIELAFTNPRPRPVVGVVLEGRVPAGMHVLPGSLDASRADAWLEISLDHGASWAAEPTVAAAVAGVRTVRPAPPERWTALRWTFTAPVAPGAAVTAAFDVRLDAPDPEGGKE